MIRREQRSDRAVAIFLFHVCGAADKLLRRIIIDEERGVTADIGDGTVDDPVVAEFRHLRNFDALNDAVANNDLCVREGFAKGEGKSS